MSQAEVGETAQTRESRLARIQGALKTLSVGVSSGGLAGKTQEEDVADPRTARISRALGVVADTLEIFDALPTGNQDAESDKDASLGETVGDELIEPEVPEKLEVFPVLDASATRQLNKSRKPEFPTDHAITLDIVDDNTLIVDGKTEFKLSSERLFTAVLAASIEDPYATFSVSELLNMMDDNVKVESIEALIEKFISIGLWEGYGVNEAGESVYGLPEFLRYVDHRHPVTGSIDAEGIRLHQQIQLRKEPLYVEIEQKLGIATLASMQGPTLNYLFLGGPPPVEDILQRGVRIRPLLATLAGTKLIEQDPTILARFQEVHFIATGIARSA